MDITVTIPDEGKRVLESWLGKDMIQPWLQHAINDKLRRRIDASVLEHTDRNPKKMIEADKLSLLKKIELSTREERDGIESEDV